MAGLTFRQAVEAAHAALEELFRATSMGLRIQICFERDRDFFAGARVQAEEPCVWAALENGGRAVGVFSAGSRQVWGGKPVRYLSDLRIHPGWQGWCWRGDLGKPRWRDLTIGDFLIAERNGGAGGMMGLWDQGGFQRLRIHGYSAMIAAVRPLWNSFASVALPRVGQVLPLGVALRGLKGRVEYGRHFLVGWEGAPPEWEEPFAFDVGRI